MSTSRAYGASGSGTTHHRKNSSKVRPASGLPAFASRFANARADVEEEPSTSSRPFAFPDRPEGSRASGAPSPQQERLGAILEDTPKAKTITSESSGRSTPSSIRTSPVRHRISPSLPYGPYEAKAGPTTPTPALMTSYGVPRNAPAWRQTGVSILRRIRYLDLLYMLLFGGCVVVFFSALAGVGYKVPTAGSAGTRPGPPTILPAPGRPETVFSQRPGQAPLVIKEDPAELAREDAERPVFARGRAPMIVQPHDLAYNKPHAVVPPLGRRPLPAQPLAVHPMVMPQPAIVEQRPGAIPEPDDHAPDLVADSPDDQHLDDAHAAHYHHPPEANVFHGHAVVSDTHDDLTEDAEEGHNIVPEPVVGSETEEEDASYDEDVVLAQEAEVEAADGRIEVQQIEPDMQDDGEDE